MKKVPNKIGSNTQWVDCNLIMSFSTKKPKKLKFARTEIAKFEIWRFLGQKSPFLAEFTPFLTFIFGFITFMASVSHPRGFKCRRTQNGTHLSVETPQNRHFVQFGGL